MKVVKAGFERLTIPEPTDKMEVLKYLEKVGRTCYKSEDKITDESCIDYLQRIRDRKHWAMLEHYIFAFYVPEWIYEDWYQTVMAYDSDPDHSHRSSFIKFTDMSAFPDYQYDDDKRYIMSASATAMNYMWDSLPYNESNLTGYGFIDICLFMLERFPEIMKVPEGYVKPENYDYDTDIKFVSRKEMAELPVEARLIHDFMGNKFTVDRGVTHEIVRHRPCAFAQESTRYCNYSKGKYNEEITVIEPELFTKEENKFLHALWELGCNWSEKVYLFLTRFGAAAQWARSVLPNSTKAELVMTARLYEWKHFFDMRADSPAHPQMREVAVPLLAQCIKEDAEIFGDQKKYLM